MGATNVTGALALKAPITSASLVTPDLGAATATSVTMGATNVTGALALKAPIAGPVFTGTATIPTAEITTETVGTSTFTNSQVFPLTTTWSLVTASTNYVADLAIPVMHFSMTTNMNFLHATNATANFTANTMRAAQFILINSSGTNWTNTLPAAWKRYGDYTDTTFYVTNGDWCRMAIQFAGPSTDQTNIQCAVAYENN
jgi:hypothetical protein